MFFLEKIKNIVEEEQVVAANKSDRDTLYDAKRMGFSDKFIGRLVGMTAEEVFALREKYAMFPVYKMIDTWRERVQFLRSLLLLDIRAGERIGRERQEENRGTRFGTIRIGQGVESTTRPSTRYGLSVRQATRR